MRVRTSVFLGVVVSLGLVQPAQAIRLPRIDAPELKVLLPDLERIHIPPVIESEPEASIGGKYGTGDQTLERELQSATAGEVGAVTRNNLARSTDNENEINRCVSATLNGVASDYEKALRDALSTGDTPVWPSFTEDFNAGISRCLTETFPAAPSSVIDEISSYLADQGAEYAQQAFDADSAAAVFIKWMNVTSNELASTIESDPSPEPPERPAGGTDSSGGGGGSSPPWGPLIIGMIVVAVAVGVVSQRRKRGPRTAQASGGSPAADHRIVTCTACQVRNRVPESARVANCARCHHSLPLA